MPIGSQGQRSVPNDSAPTTSGVGYWAPLLIAISLILAYLGYAILLYLTADHITDEQHWSRLVYIGGTLSTLVSSALGWVFGREVHRSAVDSATKEAGRARTEATAARHDAAAGRLLAAAVRSGTDPSGLKRIADELFPQTSPAPPAAQAGPDEVPTN